MIARFLTVLVMVSMLPINISSSAAWAHMGVGTQVANAHGHQPAAPSEKRCVERAHAHGPADHWQTQGTFTEAELPSPPVADGWDAYRAAIGDPATRFRLERPPRAFRDV